MSERMARPSEAKPSSSFTHLTSVNEGAKRAVER